MMKKENCYLETMRYERFEHVFKLLGGKWKLRIIYMLALHEVLHYGELKRLLHPVTHKMLAQQLKELEKTNLSYEKNVLRFLLKLNMPLRPWEGT